MVFKTVAFGLRKSYGLRKFLLLYWLLNFLAAATFIRPLGSAFRDFLSKSLVTEILAKKNLFAYYSEFLYYFRDGIQAAMKSLSIGNFVYLLAIVLMSGGLLYFFTNDEHAAYRKFWVESGRFFGRMIRFVFLYGVVFLFTFTLSAIVLLITWTALPDAISERTVFYVLFLWGIIMLLLFLLVTLLLDVARIILVIEDGESVWKSFRDALYWSYRCAGSFLLAFILIFLGIVCLGLFYWWVQKFIPVETTPEFIISFLLMQLFVLLHFWIRFSRFGALLAIMRHAGFQASQRNDTTAVGIEG